jgi:hypothetical protein
LNGIFQVIEKFTAGFRKKWTAYFHLSKISSIVYGFNLLFTFTIITVTWVFFRAGDLNQALLIFNKILNNTGGPLFTLPLQALLYGSFFTIVLIVSDFLQERNKDKHFFLENKSNLVRYVTYLSLTVIILLFGVFDNSRFIYFQF